MEATTSNNVSERPSRAERPAPPIPPSPPQAVPQPLQTSLSNNNIPNGESINFSLMCQWFYLIN